MHFYASFMMVKSTICDTVHAKRISNIPLVLPETKEETGPLLPVFVQLSPVSASFVIYDNFGFLQHFMRY